MVFLFIIFIIIIFIFSKIEVQILNFKFTNGEELHINRDFKIIVELKFLGFIPVIWLKITKQKLERLNKNEKIKELERRIIEDNKKINIKVFKNFKKLKLKIRSIKFKLEVGTENAAVTAILIPIIQMIVNLYLENKILNFKKRSVVIKPIYENQNILKFQIMGIFEIKVIHIINVIYIINKKGKVRKNERTSNRRSYDYSYE